MEDDRSWLACETLVGLLRRRAEETPDRRLYTFLDAGEREAGHLTCAELEARARAVGALLGERGLAGERALLVYPPGLEFIVAFFGCLYAGAVAVPAYPPGSRRSLPRLRAIVRDCRPAAALAPAGELDRYRELAAELPELQEVPWYATDHLAADLADGWVSPEVRGGDLAFLQYTSGSTADPKGVMVSHANLLWNEEAIRRAFGQSEDSVVGGWLPLYHDMGLIGNVLQPLYAGARCILMAPVAFLQRPRRWLDMVSRYGVTTSGGPNFAYELCVRRIAPEDREGLDLSSWSVAFNGSEPVRAETLERFAEAFAPCGFRREAFYPCYGLAEATLFVVGGERGSAPMVESVDARELARDRVVTAGPGTRPADARSLVGCGRPWLEHRVAVVDPETATPCPRGRVGEIWVSGPSVAGGYWDRPEATARDFGATLDDTGATYLRTGDLGFLSAEASQPELFVTGRLKDLIILRGRNLYPNDLERTAEAAHPALRPGGAAAVAVDVEGEERLVVVAELDRTSRDADPGEVFRAVRQAVAEEHEARVHEILLLKPGRIPKTSSGKIRRHACRAGYLAGDLEVVARSGPGGPAEAEERPADGEAGAGGPSPERRAEIEAGLRPLAAELLRVEPEEVSPDEPLTALGLDSLAAAELQQAVADRYGVEVPLGDLLDGLSLAGVAARVLEGPSDGAVAGRAEMETPPAPARHPKELPLSYGQRALWFLQGLAPESSAYHIAVAARVEGALDAPALRRSFRLLVRRHPALRAVFRRGAAGPVQRLDGDEAEVAAPVADASGWSGDRLTDALRRAADEPFDLERGPLFRVALFRRAADDHVLLLVVHHLVADFTSLAVVFEELTTVYLAETGGPPAGLDPPPVTYADFLRWQERRLAGEEGEALWRYWREALGDGPRGPVADLDLPTDRPRPPVATDRGDARPLRLGRAGTEALARLARTEGGTPFTVLLALFQALLHRLSGQDDLAVGSPASGRTTPELARVVGYLVNPVVVRGDAAGDPDFRSFLARVRRAAAGALEHQDYPFPLLTERLRPLRDPSRSPLFQVMLTFQSARAPEQRALAPFALGGDPRDAEDRRRGEDTGEPVRLGPLRLEALALPGRPVQFDLTLVTAMLGRAGRPELAGSLQFNADLFDGTTVERWLGHLGVLLAAAAARPEARLGELPLLSAAERHQLRAEWNDPVEVTPGADLLHGLVEAQAARISRAVAVVGGGAELTYGELDRRANRLARRLRGLGVGPDVPVGVYLRRSPALFATLLAIGKAGGAYLPLDPSYPRERVAFMLGDSGAPVVVTEGALAPDLDDLDGFDGQSVRLDDAAGETGDEAATKPPETVCSENLAYLIYTSGSTGRPKGVQVPHRAVVRFLAAMAERPGLGPEDVLVAVTTLSFDIAGLELFLPLRMGARVVLADRETAADGERLLRLLAASGATAMQATPATWRLLLAAGWAGEPRLKVLCGGEALPPDLAAELTARSGSVWNLYGPTETTIWSAVEGVSEGPAPGAGAAPPSDAAVLLGRPISGTAIHLLGGSLAPVPPGIPGELLIGGRGLARGYLRRPGLTADRFVPNPVATHPGERLYRTGDLARRRADGRLEYLGRLDHQVKVRGFRVELGEVEAVLSAHPAVAQGVVVARRDRAGSHRLVAYATPGEGRSAADLAEPELKAFLAERLPEHFVPSRVVPVTELPLTPNGKVDRKALAAREAAGEEQRPELEVGYAAPRSSLERQVAEVWQEVLGLDRVGSRDNFFDLGGHSLLLAEVHRRLRETLDRDLAARLTLVDLLRHPTVEAVARHLQPGDDADGHRAPRPVGGPPGAGPVGEIAIVGMAGRFPGAGSVDELWRRLEAGEELLSSFTDEELIGAGVDPALLTDPAYVKRSGVLDGADRFDAAFFDLSPREAGLMDPQHRVFLECAWHALEDAGYPPGRIREPVGVWAGVGMNTYLLQSGLGEEGSTAARYQAFIGNDKDFVPTRVSYKLDLTGPSVNVQTACSSSLVAVHLACRSLQAGECDLALAGGVTVRVPLTEGYLYEEGGILSPDGHCRAFDAEARGTVFGSGAGVVVLKPLDAARADGDRIHAVVKGSAINNDGALKVGYTAPGAAGQARVIAAALEAAGVDPDTVGLLEAHGTGTPLGDPVEVEALTEAFRRHTDRRGFCALGSVKTAVGHLDTAAGVTGLIKAVQALRYRTLPPSLHFREPNPQIDLAASPFFVSAEARPWPKNGGPRRAGVSSFGIGGTNAHVVLEEAPAPEPAEESRRPWHLLTVSARTPEARDTLSRDLAARLREEPGAPLADLAYTLQTGRPPFEHRRVVAARDREEAVVALEAAGSGTGTGGAWEAHDRVAGGERPVALLFPGQGAQHPGMAQELYETEPAFRREVDASAELLEPHLGVDLRLLLFPELLEGAPSPEEAARRLAETRLTQPALFVVEHALARLLTAWGLAPEAMLGHSIGEYVAAALAGVFRLEDALVLVAERGRLMQALPGGSMVAVELPEDEVAALLGEGLSLAAVNGPRASVVSGPGEAVEALAGRLEADGVRHRRLETSHAFHSEMMEPAVRELAERVAAVPREAPRIPFLSNVTGTWIRPEEATDPAYWGRQLRRTVRFGSALAELLAEPDRVLLEVGPGHALTNLARQQTGAAGGTRAVATLPRQRDERGAGFHLHQALGRLWLAGVEVDWRGYWAGERRRRVGLPLYPFERQRHWLEADPAERRRRRRARRGAAAGDGGPELHAPLWLQTLPSAAPPELSGNPEPWLLLADREGVVDRLAARLRAAGHAVTRVEPGEGFAAAGEGSFTVDPGSAEDYERVLRTLAEAGAAPRRIVHAWNLGAAGDGPGTVPAALADARVRAFDSLLFLARALDRAGVAEPVRWTVLSSGLHRLPGEGDPAPARALLLGPVRVLPQEYPHLSLRAVDVSLPADPEELDALADDLLAEVVAHEPSPEEAVVALRAGSRWVQRYEPAPGAGAARTGPRLREEGVYLITGGLGGVGLALAEELAADLRPRLVLLGRTAPPPREEWEALAAGSGPLAETARRLQGLEAAGAQVLTLAADVTDPEATAAAVRAAEERFGPVQGVIHAAGVAGGGLAQLRSPEEAWSVMAPKVAGTFVLAELFADPDRAADLDLLALCSSITGVAGGFGQSDYAAANAFLDAFAQARFRRGGTYTVAIDWDRWRGVGMAAGGSGVIPGLPGALGAGSAPVPGHPFLESCLAATPERHVYTTRFDPSRHWVLSEHRVAGQPTVPGTTYLEMARAALCHRRGDAPPGGSVEMRGVVFLHPLVVPDGTTRETLLVLEPAGDVHDFRVLSRAPGEEDLVEHARGKVALVDGNGSHGGNGHDGSAGRDPAALVAACSRRELTPEQWADAAGDGDAAFLVAGPRWRCLRRLHVGDAEVVAELELPEELAGDLEACALHPALLDLAAGAPRLLEEGNFLPLAYERITVRAPLGRRGFSHCRVQGGSGAAGETLTADVVLMDDDGRTLVEIQGFSMKRVGAEALAQMRAQIRAQVPSEAASSGGRDAWGLDPRDAARLFRRILDHGTLPQVVVTSLPLEEVLEETRALDRDRLAQELSRLGGGRETQSRPELAAEYVAPTDDFEARIAQVWQRVLGVDRVGVNDNFFELGGTSLAGVQLVSDLKAELGVEVSTVSVFEAPTVAALARHLRSDGPAEAVLAGSRERAEKKKQALGRGRRTAAARNARRRTPRKPVGGTADGGSEVRSE